MSISIVRIILSMSQQSKNTGTAVNGEVHYTSGGIEIGEGISATQSCVVEDVGLTPAWPNMTGDIDGSQMIGV